jgi:hypothetical protein
MAQLSWDDFSSAALTTQGLLAELLAAPDDPNSILTKFGLEQLSSTDVNRWQQTLASTVESPTRREILEYISKLLPGTAGDAMMQSEPPPTW